MTILEKITAHKRLELAEQKQHTSFRQLEKSAYFGRDILSLKTHLLKPGASGIIAEFKKRSPSKGEINPNVKVEDVTKEYVQAGASALSVLTDEHFFGGKNEFLTRARKENDRPILRKDFIIDEYQLLEAKSIGADVILLIAECLSKGEVKQLASVAKSLGLEVLMEVHSEIQLSKLCEHIDVVGVNNRNLDNFVVDVQNSIDLFSKIPNDFIKISESGISDPATVVQLRNVGFQGFLIGENFMKEKDPGASCAKFIQKINEYSTT